MEKSASRRTTSGNRWILWLAVTLTAATILTITWPLWFDESDQPVSRQVETRSPAPVNKRSVNETSGPADASKAVDAASFVFETKVEQERLLEHLEAAMKQLPRRADVLHLSAVTYAEILQTDRSIELFKQALEIAPADPEMSRDYADVLIQIGKPEQAVEVLRAVKQPSNGIVAALAEALAQAGSLMEALALIDSIVADSEDDPELRLQQAKLQNQLSKFEMAEVNARFAVEKLPARREAYIALATALVRQGKRAAAREIQNSMPKIQREQTVDDEGYRASFRDFAAHTYAVLSSIYVASGLYEDARAEVDHALLLGPNAEDPLVAKIDILRKQNDLGGAFEFQSRLAKACPDNAFHQANAASLAAAVGRLYEAELFMRQAARLDPSGNTDARFAELLSAIGKHDEAIQSARLAVKRLRNKDAYLLLVACLRSAGREAEAVAVLLEAQQLFPGQL
jgi:tetratricopeptide (TPR) repeat protein